MRHSFEFTQLQFKRQLSYDLNSNFQFCEVTCQLSWFRQNADVAQGRRWFIGRQVVVPSFAVANGRERTQLPLQLKPIWRSTRQLRSAKLECQFEEIKFMWRLLEFFLHLHILFRHYYHFHVYLLQPVLWNKCQRPNSQNRQAVLQQITCENNISPHLLPDQKSNSCVVELWKLLPVNLCSQILLYKSS